MAPHAVPGTHPYRYADGEAFETTARHTPRLPYPVTPLSPLHSSWHIPSETGSVPDTSIVGYKDFEQPAYTNLAHDFTRHGDYGFGRELFPPSRGYDARALQYPLDPHAASSQFTSPRGMVDQLIPRTTAHPIIYTNDAGMKLCDTIRRQCFNCRATATTTWRRSVLNPEKMVCNKCGLFERTHAVPRPKTFPRRRRSLRSSAHRNVDLPPSNHLEYRHRNDHPSIKSFTGHFPNGFGSMGGETNSQDTTWMSDNVSSIPPRLGPSPQATTYRADFHLLSNTIPAEAAHFSSHLSDNRLPK
jgi:hypothetical protein